MLAMARGQGQGYIGQGLGIADVLAALYFHELRYDPQDLGWADRDRFLLSTGHYSIALWAALAEAGILPIDELATYGADDSRLEMRTLDTTPGVEMIGGSLGHGLGQGVGHGARPAARTARRRAVFVELSDGEMQEGSTWEAAMSAQPFQARQSRRADRLQRHPGRRRGRARHGAGRRQVARLRLGDAGDRRQRHGGDRRRALPRARERQAASRKAIVLRTLPGKGVPTHRDAREGAFRPRRRRRMGRHHRRELEREAELIRWLSRGRTLAMGQDEATGSGAPSVEAPFGHALAELGRARPEIVGLTADLGKYTDILPFRDAFPDRFFNVGMAEQNLVAVAAGLARTGYTPVRHDLRRVRHAPRLRFHRHRLRA